MASDVFGTSDGCVVAFPDAPERRLRMALRQLEAALAAQRSEVAAFRADLGALTGALAGLEKSAVTLKAQLDDAAEDAVLAQQACGTLMTTAEVFERQTACT